MHIRSRYRVSTVFAWVPFEIRHIGFASCAESS